MSVVTLECGHHEHMNVTWTLSRVDTIILNCKIKMPSAQARQLATIPAPLARTINYIIHSVVDKELVNTGKPCQFDNVYIKPHCPHHYSINTSCIS